MPTGDVMCRFGVVPDNADFDSSLLCYRKNLTRDDAIDHLDERHAYVAIYNPENDADYRPVIEGLLGEIAVATEPFEHCINGYSSYIFISARGSVTPYHMDREMNFLFQQISMVAIQTIQWRLLLFQNPNLVPHKYYIV